MCDCVRTRVKDPVRMYPCIFLQTLNINIFLRSEIESVDYIVNNTYVNFLTDTRVRINNVRKISFFSTNGQKIYTCEKGKRKISDEVSNDPIKIYLFKKIGKKKKEKNIYITIYTATKFTFSKKKYVSRKYSPLCIIIRFVRVSLSFCET